MPCRKPVRLPGNSDSAWSRPPCTYLALYSQSWLITHSPPVTNEKVITRQEKKEERKKKEDSTVRKQTLASMAWVSVLAQLRPVPSSGTLSIGSWEHQMTAMKAAVYKCQSLTQTLEILEFHIQTQIPLLTPSSSQLLPMGESGPHNSWH